MAAQSGPSTSVVLFSLLLGTVVTGSAELLTVGLLPLISDGLGVSVAAAGTLFSTYALGVAVGGPVLTAATIRLDRRRVLVGSMALFGILVITPAVVPQFELFVAARLLSGALQGMFMAAAFTTATAVVPAQRAGRAVAVVIAGFAISTVLGLPLGLLAGSVLGWRGALLLIGGFALIVVWLLIAVVPTVPGGEPWSKGGLRHALSPRVLGMLAVCLLFFAAPGAVMAYLMPLLERVTGVSGPQASAILLGFGAASVVGSFLGGRLADTNAARALVWCALGLAAAFAGLYLARSSPVLAVIAILAWAVAASSAPPSIQNRTVSLAGPGGALAASLPASAASAGIALGSTASGLAYAAAGPPAVILTGGIIAVGALTLSVATRRLRPTADESRSAGFRLENAADPDQTVASSPAIA